MRPRSVIACTVLPLMILLLTPGGLRSQVAPSVYETLISFFSGQFGGTVPKSPLVQLLNQDLDGDGVLGGSDLPTVVQSNTLAAQGVAVSFGGDLKKPKNTTIKCTLIREQGGNQKLKKLIGKWKKIDTEAGESTWSFQVAKKIAFKGMNTRDFVEFTIKTKGFKVPPESTIIYRVLAGQG